MNDTNDYLPVAPLELEREEQMRYEQIRILRRYVDHESRTPVIVSPDGNVRKGQQAWRKTPTNVAQANMADEKRREQRRVRYQNRIRLENVRIG